MTDALADLFAAARSPVIDWGGTPTYAVWEIDPLPDELVVEFLAAKIRPTQGLAIKIDRGSILANGTEGSHITLWRDTAPDVTRLLISGKAGATLKVWNIWRGSVGGHDVAQAWLGNSGMRVEASTHADAVILRCSDGEAAVTFEDLVVSLRSA